MSMFVLSVCLFVCVCACACKCLHLQAYVCDERDKNIYMSEKINNKIRY